jgi:hypothetical protein
MVMYVIVYHDVISYHCTCQRILVYTYHCTCQHILVFASTYLYTQCPVMVHTGQDWQGRLRSLISTPRPATPVDYSAPRPATPSDRAQVTKPGSLCIRTAALARPARLGHHCATYWVLLVHTGT